MGGVLLVKYEDDLWRPVLFILKALNETEHNYKINDKKILLRSLEALLGGCKSKV